MMQLLALIAMEPPGSLEAERIRDEKVKALRAVRPLAPGMASACCVRGQYTRGLRMGREAVGYREEKGVASGSMTETYVALKLHLDNWRWAGVPFYLRTGKRLPKQAAEVVIQFKAPPAVLFAAPNLSQATIAPLQPNALVLRIQPDEGICIRMNAKTPGTVLRIQPVRMDFPYGGAFETVTPDAYERLLLDAIMGETTLFIRGDETERAWMIVDGLLQLWEAAPSSSPLNFYEVGTWGPVQADEFIRRDGRDWRQP